MPNPAPNLPPDDPIEDKTLLWRGRLWIVGAAILWSSSSFFVKNQTFVDWPIEQRGVLLAFWRALFAGTLLLPLARMPRLKKGMIPLAVSFVLMNATYLSSMTLTTAGNAIWLQNTAPVWVFLVGVLFLRDTITRGDLFLLLFASLGVGLILSHEIYGAQQKGVALGVMSGVCYAGVVMCIRQLRDVNSAWLVSLMLLITAGVMLPYVLHVNVWPSGSQLVLLACFGLFQMGLPYVMFAHGLRTIPSQEAAGIGLLEPVLVPVWVLSTEPQSWWTWVGGGLIFTGLLLRYLGAWIKSRETRIATDDVLGDSQAQPENLS